MFHSRNHFQPSSALSLTPAGLQSHDLSLSDVFSSKAAPAKPAPLTPSFSKQSPLWLFLHFAAPQSPQGQFT
jgi:hypothetical protein